MTTRKTKNHQTSDADGNGPDEALRKGGFRDGDELPPPDADLIESVAPVLFPINVGFALQSAGAPRHCARRACRMAGECTMPLETIRSCAGVTDEVIERAAFATCCGCIAVEAWIVAYEMSIQKLVDAVEAAVRPK